MSDPTLTDDLLGPQPVDSTGALVPRHREWKFVGPLTCTVINGQVVIGVLSNSTATWADVLANGSSSGANSPIIATGQKIRGQTTLVLNAPTGSTVKTQINDADALDISNTRALLSVPSLRFGADQVAPSIYQEDDATNGITADTLVVRAQRATGAAAIGGAAEFRSGTGTTRAGYVFLKCGTVTKFEVRDTGYTFVFNANFGWGDPAVTPILYQLGTASGAGKTMTIRAQGTTDPAAKGGTLALRGGQGGAANGDVVLGCYDKDRLTITPTSEIWSY